jgi:hypothetical protein
MAQEKNPNKSFQNDVPQKNTQQKPDDNKTFGNEPPMEEPQSPEHPDEYEVTGDEPHEPVKPTLH